MLLYFIIYCSLGQIAVCWFSKVPGETSGSLYRQYSLSFYLCPMKPVISLTVKSSQINLTVFRDNAAIFILS